MGENSSHTHSTVVTPAALNCATAFECSFCAVAMLSAYAMRRPGRMAAGAKRPVDGVGGAGELGILGMDDPEHTLLAVDRGSPRRLRARAMRWQPTLPMNCPNAVDEGHSAPKAYGACSSYHCDERYTGLIPMIPWAASASE